MSALLDRLRASSALNGGNAAFIEALYESYLSNPESVSSAWRSYFDAMQPAPDAPADRAHEPIRQAFAKRVREHRRGPGEGISPSAAEKQAAVLRLINAYRVRGHQYADLNPLHLRERPEIPDLDPSYHGLLDADRQRVFHTGSLFADDQLTLDEILLLVKTVYTGTIGSEYMHITDTAQKRWIQKRLERLNERPRFNLNEKRWCLRLLSAAEGLENYLHTRYVGQKRFSLEGGESLIPLLDEIIQRAGSQDIKEIVMGMAHRGRLNVLVNILGKSPESLFQEFEGRAKQSDGVGSGDVKYHKGFSSDVGTPGGPVHLALAFNPSHLEIINPVVEGSVRARQRRRRDLIGSQVLPLLIHGDASFAGQGVVMETLNMSQTRCYSTGGTVHIVINNQIGFTTSNPLDARSTLYCTDVAKMVQAPIFHVNGDDPEAVLFVGQLALDFRQQFHKDVVIDLVCYRRHGHNEADEPAVTQPMMYKKIRQHPTTRTLYAERLVAEGILQASDAQGMVEQYRDELDQGNIVSRPILEHVINEFAVDWRPYTGKHWRETAHTALPLETIQDLSNRLLRLPKGFELHPRVARIMDARRQMAGGNQMIDWGFAETIAYASLLMDGVPIRLSGQDSGRGTFFHRHAALHNQVNGDRFIPLQYLDPDQAPFVVVDSLLSEEAVLGFEYGFATAEPEALTLWEAQFGDFANDAQIMIDQFITSGESKWLRMLGLL
ncbi:MAG: 2-oxoglutarate dehydrogenase E1 component, partial [Chromatiales bacterium]|nr:2-oxoglutarate dehydrogenase E1 component [Chromatiales bacterium]